MQAAVATVEYYKNFSGKCPIVDFLDSQSQKTQSKILRVFNFFKEYGVVNVIPHVRKLTGLDLWEIRILGKNNIRVIYAIPYKKLVLVLHGFVKKTNKTPKKEIEIAENRFKDWKMRAGLS